jgi:membrane fusion protein, heavy metal efflux system
MNKKIIVLLIASLTIFSCRQNQPDDHDHDHEEVKLMITAYSEEFEVFAEADPFVVGKTSAILAHFTHLHNFKPLQEGKITLSLIIGNRGIRQVVENPVKPGIYSFALQPEVAGTGRLVFELETGGKAYILEAIDITVFADEHTAIHAAEENSSDHPAAVSFTKEQSWVISFATDGVQSRPMGTIIKTVGEVLPAHGDEVLLTASANGIVNLTDNRLYEGALLSSGQSLLNISGAGLAEGNALQRFHEARNNYERARADYERLSELAKEKIVSERELLQARNEAANTKIIFDNALIEEQGNYFVFVQIHPESFEKREVFIGKTDGIHTEILRGLNENERIVSRGALMVKMAAASGNIDPHSGHVH